MATLRSGARVTAAEVKEILDTDMADASLHNHINAASVMVDRIDANENVVLDAETLTLIELYWSAEVACTQDPRAMSESIKSSSVKYDVRTTYGEQAIQMDSTGTLSSDSKGKAGVSVPNVKGLSHDYELNASADPDDD